MKFKVGDMGRCIKDDNIDQQFIGKEGEIISIQSKYKDESSKYPYKTSFAEGVGHSWQNAFGDHELELITKTKNKMQRVSTMLKRLLDADTQILYKAGYLNGDLELTSKGKDVLNTITFSQNKAELVKLAKEYIEEEKENK